MLARTADNLFWLARSMERADYIARTIEATAEARIPAQDRRAKRPANGRARSTPPAPTTASSRSTASSTRRAAVEYLTFDRTNPSSICNCLENARTAGRAVRTALTAETWTAINDAWLELKRFEASHRFSRPMDRVALTRFLDYVKKASLDFDGSCYRTMLRNDAYWFNRLGIFIERADNTARLLDVKYHLLLPSTEAVGGSLDYFQWVAILRAVSAATAYHWVYRDRVKPWLIADLLILKRAMPRSLISCYESIDRALDSLARDDGRSGLAQRQARAMHAKLERSSMTQIFQGGLHEFITTFIEDNAGPVGHDLRAISLHLSGACHADPDCARDNPPLRAAGPDARPEPAADAARLRQPVRARLADRPRHRQRAQNVRGRARQCRRARSRITGSRSSA